MTAKKKKAASKKKVTAKKKVLKKAKPKAAVKKKVAPKPKPRAAPPSAIVAPAMSPSAALMFSAPVAFASMAAPAATASLAAAVPFGPGLSGPLMASPALAAAAALGPQPPGVELVSAFDWANYGTNLSGRVATLYRLSNGPANEASAGLAAIRWAVRHLASSGGSGSVSGSRWSFSPVAFSTNAMFDVRAMAKRLAFDATELANPAEVSSLVQVQAGCTIEQLISYAEGLGRDLKAMGGNCGQTVAGAISTGTHGGFTDQPGFPDMVRALYLVGEGGTRHWIERASRPVLAPALVTAYRNAGVQVHVDSDAFFNHAVVSLGTFGLVFSVVLETVPSYFVKLDRRAVDFDDALDRQTFDRDFSAYGPDPVLDFATVVNPYRMSSSAGRWRGNGVGTAVRTVVQPATSGAPLPGGNVSTPINDADLARLLALLAAAVPGAVSPLVDGLMSALYGPRAAQGPMSVAYPLSLTHAPTLGMELGVPGPRAREVFGVILDFIQSAATPMPGVLAIRQTTKSDATLSLARWAPTTTFEFCLLKVGGTEELLTGLLDQLDRQAIDFTVHLGMLHGRTGAGQAYLTPQRFERMFGGAAVVADWVAARRRTCPSGNLFSNDLTRSLGLTS